MIPRKKKNSQKHSSLVKHSTNEISILPLLKSSSSSRYHSPPKSARLPPIPLLGSVSSISSETERSSLTDRAGSHSFASLAMIKNTERKLELQHRLDMISSASIDPVIIVSEQGIILSLNDEALKLFGYNILEINDQNVKVLMPRKFAISHDHYLDRYKKTRVKHVIGVQRSHLLGMKKDGTVFEMNLKVSEIVERDGSVFIGYVRSYATKEELSRAESLVAHMLPRTFLEQSLTNQKTIASKHDIASIVAVGMEGLLDYVQQCETPELVVQQISNILLILDDCCEKTGLEFIRNTGDTYLAGAGVASTALDASARAIEGAVDIFEKIQKSKTSDSSTLGASMVPLVDLKIGIASGCVFSGVTKSYRFGFDVWGEVVSMAQTLKDDTPVNCIKVCKQTYTLTKHRYQFEQVDTKLYKGHPLYSSLLSKGEAGKAPDSDAITVSSFLYKRKE